MVFGQISAIFGPMRQSVRKLFGG